MTFDRNQTEFTSPLQKEVWQQGVHVMPLDVSLADVTDPETREGGKNIYNCIMEILADMYEHTDVYTERPRWYTGDYLVWLTSGAKPMKKHTEEYNRYLQRLPQFGFVCDEASGEWSNPRYPLFFAYYPQMAQLFKERKKNLGGYLERLDFRLFAPKIKLTLDDILRPLSDAEREVCLDLHKFALSKGLKAELKDPYTIRYLHKKLYSFQLHNHLFRVQVIYRLHNGKIIPESLDRFLQVAREQSDRDDLIAYIQGGICVCTACNGARALDKRCGVWVNIDGARRLVSMPCSSAISKYRRGKDTCYTDEDVRMLKRLLEVRVEQVNAYVDGAHP